MQGEGRENGKLFAMKQEMMETEAEERWAKPGAAMPVLRDVKTTMAIHEDGGIVAIW